MDAPADGGVGGTYVGNPVAQAAALAVLDVIEDEGLVERSAAIGETIRARMLAWQERWPADRRRPRPRRDARDRARRRSGDEASRRPSSRSRSSTRRSQRGLLLITCGVYGNCIRVLVPLVIADAELDEALGVWEEALEARALGIDGRVGSPRRWSATSSRTATSSRSSSAPEACRASTGRTTGCSSATSRSRCCTSTTARTRTYVERFRREARAVATLSHPNIVTVIDRGEHDGRQFIVFEYVDGREPEAADRARAARCRSRRRSSSAIQIARGLAFAHQQGLVHRDVKPQNVLLNGDGEAKVTDFGIARSLDVQHGMTQTGTVLGTSRLHRAGAGAGPARRRAHRRLLARRRALRAAHRRGAVPRRELRRRRDAAHQRAAAVGPRPSGPTCRRGSRPRSQSAIAKDPARPLPDDGGVLPRARGVPRRGCSGVDGRDRRSVPTLAAARAPRAGGVSPWPLRSALLVALLAIGAVVAALS